MLAPDFWPESEAFLILEGLRQDMDEAAYCTAVAVTDARGRAQRRFSQGDEAHFFFEFAVTRHLDAPLGGLSLWNAAGAVVYGRNALQFGEPALGPARPGVSLRYHVSLNLELAPGDYWFVVGLASTDSKTYADYQAGRLGHLELANRVTDHCRVRNLGPLEVSLMADGKLRHHGLANLPGRMLGRQVDGVVRPPTGFRPAESGPLQSTGLHEPRHARLIYLASYPRSGNLWLRNLIEHYLDRRVSSVYAEAEAALPTPGGTLEPGEFVEYENLQAPVQKHLRLSFGCGDFLTPSLRQHLTTISETFFVKTHEYPFDQYEDREGVVYLVRHPAAAIWSYYWFIQDHALPGHDRLALEDVVAGEVLFGSWSEHVGRWLSIRAALGERFVLVKYEDLSDELAVCRLISGLSGLPRRSILGSFPPFERWQPSNPRLYRQGRPDDWRTGLSAKQKALVVEKHGPVMKELGYEIE